MKHTLFSLRGRITRSSFWKGIGIVFAVNVATTAATSIVATSLRAPGQDGASQSGGAPIIVLVVLGFALFMFNVWTALGLTVKRYHDRDKSGWWMLIQLVPVVGTVWSFVETGFLTGSEGPNRFGPDPLPGRRPEVAFA